MGELIDAYLNTRRTGDSASEPFQQSPAVTYARTAPRTRPMPRVMRPPMTRLQDQRLAPTERSRAAAELRAPEYLPGERLPPSNQFADAGQQALEMTGLPAVRRGARETTRAVATDSPEDAPMALGELGLGAFNAFSLPSLLAGGGPRGARPAPRPAATQRPPPRNVTPRQASDANNRQDGALTALRRELREHDFDAPATMPDLPEIDIPLTQLRRGQIGSLDRADARRYASMETDAPPILVRRQGNGWHIIDGNRRALAAELRGSQNVRAKDASALFSPRPEAPQGGMGASQASDGNASPGDLPKLRRRPKSIFTQPPPGGFFMPGAN